MSRSYDRDDDRDLPWDPMWAYVLGEDNDDRDNRDDNTRHNNSAEPDRYYYNYEGIDSSRDTGDGTSGGTILKKLWKRRESGTSVSQSSSTATIPTHSRSVGKRDEWSWEIDTSQFSLMSDESSSRNNKTNNGSSNSNDKKKWIATSTKKIRDSIGTVWRETPGQNRSILSRKPT